MDDIDNAATAKTIAYGLFSAFFFGVYAVCREIVFLCGGVCTRESLANAAEIGQYVALAVAIALALVMSYNAANRIVQRGWKWTVIAAFVIPALMSGVFVSPVTDLIMMEVSQRVL